MADAKSHSPPEELIVECCVALAARYKAGGDWPDHRCPECMWKVAEYFNSRDNPQAIFVAENYIGHRAIMRVAREAAKR